MSDYNLNAAEELRAHLLRTNFKEPEVGTMTSCTYTFSSWDFDEESKMIWLKGFMENYITAAPDSYDKELYTPKRIVKRRSHEMPCQKTIFDYLRTEQKQERIDYLLDILFYMKYKDKFIFRFL